MNAMAEEVSERVMDNIRDLHKTILDHSKKYDVDDTFAVATLVHMHHHQCTGWFQMKNLLRTTEMGMGTGWSSRTLVLLS